MTGCGGREEIGLLARFWRSNALNEIRFYHYGIGEGEGLSFPIQ